MDEEGVGRGEVVSTPLLSLESEGAVNSGILPLSPPAKSINQVGEWESEPDGDGTEGSEVLCTLLSSAYSDGDDDQVLEELAHDQVPIGCVEGEVSSTPPYSHRSVQKDTSPSAPKCRKPIRIIASAYPVSVQTDIINNGKPNRTRIQDRVHRLLQEHNQESVGVRRMRPHGNLLIKAPPTSSNIPFWGFRASGILPQRLMDNVINSLASAEEAGCRPHINPLKKAKAKAIQRQKQGLPPLAEGGSRSDYEVPFHIGIFKHPSQVFTQPWVTRDTLQGMRGDGATRKLRVTRMMELCKSIDNLVNGRVQRLLRDIAPDVLSKYRKFARLRATSDRIIKHDMDQHDLPDNLQKFDANRWPFLRFGNLGTTVAIGRGQSEKLHLDVHDDEELPTILMVLGRDGEDWDHSDGNGDIILPTLGLAIPLYPGDIFIFYASLIPHQVKLLPEHERHKRTVATLFTCAPTRKYLEHSEDLLID